MSGRDKRTQQQITEAQKAAELAAKIRKREMQQDTSNAAANRDVERMMTSGDQASGSKLQAKLLAEETKKETKAVLDVRSTVDKVAISKVLNDLLMKQLGLDPTKKPKGLEVNEDEQGLAVNNDNKSTGLETKNFGDLMGAVNAAADDLGFSRWDMFARPFTTIAKVVVFLERELDTNIDIPKSTLNRLVHTKIMAKVETFRDKGVKKGDIGRLVELEVAGKEQRSLSKTEDKHTTMSIYEAIKAYRQLNTARVKAGGSSRRVDDNASQAGEASDSMLDYARKKAATNMNWAASKISKPFKTTKALSFYDHLAEISRDETKSEDTKVEDILSVLSTKGPHRLLSSEEMETYKQGLQDVARGIVQSCSVSKIGEGFAGNKSSDDARNKEEVISRIRDAKKKKGELGLS